MIYSFYIYHGHCKFFQIDAINFTSIIMQLIVYLLWVIIVIFNTINTQEAKIVNLWKKFYEMIQKPVCTQFIEEKIR